MVKKKGGGDEGWTTVEKKSTYVKKEIDPSLKTAPVAPKPLYEDKKNKIGSTVQEKKYHSGTNKQRQAPTGNRVKDWDDDEGGHNDGNSAREIGMRISQLRTSKGLTQVELAALINEKVQVVSQYESGKVAVSDQVLRKFEGALGKKLKLKK